MFSQKPDILKKNYGRKKRESKAGCAERKVPTARKGNEFADPENSLAGGENG